MSTELTLSASADLNWFKSSYSGSDGGDCVEVATEAETVHVRDSKNTRGPILRFPGGGWSAFLTHTREQRATGN